MGVESAGAVTTGHAHFDAVDGSRVRGAHAAHTTPEVAAANSDAPENVAGSAHDKAEEKTGFLETAWGWFRSLGQTLRTPARVFMAAVSTVVIAPLAVVGMALGVVTYPWSAFLFWYSLAVFVGSLELVPEAMAE